MLKYKTYCQQCTKKKGSKYPHFEYINYKCSKLLTLRNESYDEFLTRKTTCTTQTTAL